MKKKPTQKEKQKKTEIITFREPFWSVGQLTDNEPSCFNGSVNVVRYKITVEVLDEPVAVIHERLQALWDATTNYHQHAPLQREAQKFGYELKGDMGGKARKQ